MYTFTGCSGFHYDDWKGAFYPKDIPKNKWLAYYAKHFKTVEINNSFYGLPKKSTLITWHEQTPGHFRFSMKGSRYITHMKKLVDDEELRDGIKKFYVGAQILKGKLGCVLWQLPGNLQRSDKKLDNFCSLLSSHFKNVIEFRHPSWFTDKVFKILENHDVSYCMISAPDNLPEQIKTTTDTGYLRFHGKNAWYRYEYSEEEIKKWSLKLQELTAKRVYIYFNNDYETNAIKNARQMIKEMNEK